MRVYKQVYRTSRRHVDGRNTSQPTQNLDNLYHCLDPMYGFRNCVCESYDQMKSVCHSVYNIISVLVTDKFIKNFIRRRVAQYVWHIDIHVFSHKNESYKNLELEKKIESLNFTRCCVVHNNSAGIYRPITIFMACRFSSTTWQNTSCSAKFRIVKNYFQKDKQILRLIKNGVPLVATGSAWQSASACFFSFN